MKEAVKWTIRAISLLTVLPAVLLYGIHAAVIGSDKAFPGW